MARLKLSPSGLRGPLDLVAEPEAAAEPEAPRIAAVPPATPKAPRRPTIVAPVAETPAAPATTKPAPAVTPEAATPEAVTPEPPEAATPEAIAPEPVAPAAPASALVGDLPAWATDLDRDALQPGRLLGRPKQTALILDRELSARADALVAATGPRVTFAALVTAIVHFHLPADGGDAARTIGAYRRRRLESLEQPWEERNARIPEALRDGLDDVVAGATGKVAAVRRSTLVNALLDAHLPSDADGAARLVTRMEMVRGGAFLEL